MGAALLVDEAEHRLAGLRGAAADGHGVGAGARLRAARAGGRGARREQRRAQREQDDEIRRADGVSCIRSASSANAGDRALFRLPAFLQPSAQRRRALSAAPRHVEERSAPGRRRSVHGVLSIRVDDTLLRARSQAWIDHVRGDWL
jgi:hypothetical protein